MSHELKMEEDIFQLASKYGIVHKEKFGDAVAAISVSSNQENIQKIVWKHYKRTKLRDYEECVKEIRSFLSYQPKDDDDQEDDLHHKKKVHFDFGVPVNSSTILVKDK